MYITRHLIANWINLQEISNAQISKALNNCGLETKIIFDYQALNKKLKVATILSKKKHHLLTNLNVTIINDGEKDLSIMCGANNFKVGDKVILAVVGTILSPGVVIKKRKFADIYSEGMLCSWQELNIDNKESNNDAIAILPQHAQIGDLPLEYVFLNDCVFKIQHPWNQKTSATAYIAAKYIAKYFDLSWNHNTATSPQEETIANAKKNTFTGIIYIINKQSQKTPPQILKQLSLHQIPTSENIFLDLARYVELETGIRPQVTFSHETTITKINANFFGAWNKIKSTPSSTPSVYVDIHTTSDDSHQKAKLMPFFSLLAHQRYLFWIQKITTESKINSKTSKKEILETQTTNIKIDYINAVLGTNLTFKNLQKICVNTAIKLKQLTPTTIKFTLPQDHYWKNDNEIIGEIVKYYNISQVPNKSIYPDQIQDNPNPTTRYLMNLNKYLLNLGLQRVKTFTFQKNAKANKQAIKIATHKENNILQTSLINNLMSVNNHGKNHIFTIDKVFQNQNSQWTETLKLGIIWQNDWIKNKLMQEKITINTNFLMKIIENILQNFNLENNSLFKTGRSFGTQKTINVHPRAVDFLINSQGYEDIYYKRYIIGKIGIIESTQASIKGNLFLEINLNKLLELAKNNRKTIIFKPKNNEITFVYQDFSLQILNDWNEKVYLNLNKEKILELNYFEYIIDQIERCDKAIFKIEFIDFFQNEKITLRIWKKKDIHNKDKDRLLFAKLENKIKMLKNVKIMEKVNK